MNLLNKLGFGSPRATQSAADASIAQGSDDDVPAPGQEFAQFGAGCFWGVELAFQRVPGVTKSEVGYTQGFVHSPSYEDVCSGTTNHSEVVKVQFDPKQCSFDALLDTFWARHDPTTLNRQVFKLHLAVNLETESTEWLLVWSFVLRQNWRLQGMGRRWNGQHEHLKNSGNSFKASINSIKLDNMNILKLQRFQ